MRIFTAAILLCICAVAVSAKSLRTTSAHASSAARAVIESRGSMQAIKSFETRLIPFLQARISRQRLPAAVYVPSQEDLFLLPKIWSQTSRQFQETYKAATTIPADYLMYATPGGHLEVYYATASIDPGSAVDAEDQYGYDAANWRQRTGNANGVPDYIDEVAWALDSAWAMEIERFGFVKPVPSDATRGSSGKYKVIIRAQGDLYYGMTWPGLKISAQGPGYSSFVEIRNEWSGDEWNVPPYIDYQIHPEKGVRVTAVHEFFHGIQYTMTWNVVNLQYLDLFPLSWLEGTSVLMEELGFGDVNDYLQYSSGYFHHPQMSLFNDALNTLDNSNYVYEHSLVAKFLYEHAGPAPGINFIKSVFVRNYAARSDFDNLAKSAAAALSTTWTRLLGGFHEQSFFTGSRAVPGVFFSDAPLLGTWTWATDSVDSSFTVTKRIDPRGMQTFAFRADPTQADTIAIAVAGAGGPAAADDWAAGVVLMPVDTAQHNSLVVLTFANSRSRLVTVPGWRQYYQALVIVTNADGDSARSASVTFQACSLAYPANVPVHAAIPVDAPAACTLSFTPPAGLHCTVSGGGTSLSNAQTQAAEDGNLLGIGQPVRLYFPLTWSWSAVSIRLSIWMPVAGFQAAAPGADPATDVTLCYWDDAQGQWQKLVTSTQTSQDRICWSATTVQSGTYAVFAVRPAEAPLIYPNPVRSGGQCIIKAKQLARVRIYALDGDVLFQVQRRMDEDAVVWPWRRNGDISYSVIWDLRATNGRPMRQGTCIADINWKSNGRTLRAYRKIFVLPLR